MSMVPSGLPLVFARNGSFGPGSEVNITNCGFEGFTNGTIVIESFESDGTTDSLFLAASSVFANNTGTVSAGAIDIGGAVRATVMIEDTEFRNNTSGLGAVNIDGQGEVSPGTSVTIMASDFFNNTASVLDSDAAGAVTVLTSNGTVEVIASRFVGNTGLSTDGGAVFVADARVVNLTSGDPNTRSTPTCQFVENENVALNGGAVSLVRVTESVTVDGCIFERNAAREDGGALKIDASQDAGASNINVTIESSQFLNNEAFTGNGAGVFLGDGSFGVLTVNSSTFQGNNATINSGGGIFVFLAQEVQLEDNLFDGNSASLGAGILADTVSNVTIVSSQFLNNEASDSGGGVDLSTVNVLTVKSSTFQGNSAATIGGGIRVPNAQEVQLEDNLFDGNRASQGGGIFAGTADFDFISRGDVYTDNDATSGNGGAVSLDRADIAFFENSRFLRNTAASNGGGVNFANARNALVLSNATFIDNESGRLGGGFNVVYDGLFSVRPSLSSVGGTFRNNTAGVGNSTGSGGAGRAQNVEFVTTSGTNFMRNRYVCTRFSNGHYSLVACSQILLAIHTRAHTYTEDVHMCTWCS